LCGFGKSRGTHISATVSTKPKAAQPRTPFDIEKALMATMRSPDEVYNTVPDDWRYEFKEKLAKTIQLLRLFATARASRL
jgi:hypothetical protein